MFSRTLANRKVRSSSNLCVRMMCMYVSENKLINKKWNDWYINSNQRCCYEDFDLLNMASGSTDIGSTDILKIILKSNAITTIQMYLGECWSWLGRLNRLPNTLLMLIDVRFYLLRPLSHLKFNIEFTQCSCASGSNFWNSVDFDHWKWSADRKPFFRWSMSFLAKL